MVGLYLFIKAPFRLPLGGYSDASYVSRRLSVLNVDPRDTTFFSGFSNGQPAKVGKKALGGPDEVLEPLKGIVRPYLSI